MLSVVVPATDRPAGLERCLEAIRASLPAGAELVVQREPGGAGPAEARNRGALRARGEVLVFVDADVVVAPDALVRIAERFEHDDSLGALFGAYDDRPAAPGAVSRFRNLLHHHVHASSPGTAQTFWAGLGAVRSDAFWEAGGFDAERYPRPSIEDIELGVRLRDRGRRIELDPGIRGTHLKRWRLRSMVATDLARRGAPWVRLQLERSERARTLASAPRQQVAAALGLAATLAALLRRPGAALAALAAMAAANAPFYALLARRGGPRLALAGVGLHAVHHLTAVASVPLGLALHLAGRRRGA